MALIDDMRAARASAARELLSRADAEGAWTGHLSSSALATATAAFALGQLGDGVNDQWVVPALQWLCATQCADGGWGDSPESPSNISTTLLVWSALSLEQASHNRLCERAEGKAKEYLARLAGGTSPAQLVGAIMDRYGKDRTFSVPILTMAALAGQLGEGPAAWRYVQPLPFELAALPRRWWRRLGLPVVSYAAPALIAIGQARFRHAPPRFLLTRWLRRLAVAPTLRLLAAIQPPSGGFLEAAPLTSFVLMSLCSMGLARHVVAQKAAEFLRFTVRPDGSWPIDTNLSVWVTTHAARAIASSLDETRREELRQWILQRQWKIEHPYTQAAPGAWAWTELSGGVGDADDTAGALLALRELDDESQAVRSAAQAGARWLMDLQNSDGGIPTFCRGWGKLPFDRSGADLTAHALLAWQRWRGLLGAGADSHVQFAMNHAVGFLRGSQGPEGAWAALWFGNQHASDQQNLVYGTSRVVLGLEGLAAEWPVKPMIFAGLGYLLRAQNADGGWGGEEGVDSSVEETAVAVEALAACLGLLDPANERSGAIRQAIEEGSRHLLERTRQGTDFPEAPIGLYFARLWYSERLYPILFTISALDRAMAALEKQPSSSAKS